MKNSWHLSRQLALRQPVVYMRSIFVGYHLLGDAIGNETKKVLGEEIEEIIEGQKRSAE